MTTQLTPEQILDNVIGLGRAYVRVTEAADYILTREPPLVERWAMRLASAICRYRLRQLVAELPAEMTAEILAASEKMTGPVRGFTRN